MQKNISKVTEGISKTKVMHKDQCKPHEGNISDHLNMMGL